MTTETEMLEQHVIKCVDDAFQSLADANLTILTANLIGAGKFTEEEREEIFRIRNLIIDLQASFFDSRATRK